MTVNHSVRRIASLSAFLLAIGVASASQAGVIPWVYDAVFGPVRRPVYGYGYSPYVVSYSRPVVVRSSSGCSPCSGAYYAPVIYSQPYSGCGGCGPVAIAPACGPCGAVSSLACAPLSGCQTGCLSVPTPATPNTAPATNGKSAWNSSKKPAEPSPATAPTPRTFSEEPKSGATPAGATTDDGFGPATRNRVKPAEPPVEGVEANRPASKDPEPTIINPKSAPAKSLDDQFKKPLEIDSDPLELEPKKETNGEAQIRLPLSKVNLDSKIAWHIAPQYVRVPLHSSIAKASVARRIPGRNAQESDWTPVVARPFGTQLVRK